MAIMGSSEEVCSENMEQHTLGLQGAKAALCGSSGASAGASPPRGLGRGAGRPVPTDSGSAMVATNTAADSPRLPVGHRSPAENPCFKPFVDKLRETQNNI